MKRTTGIAVIAMMVGAFGISPAAQQTTDVHAGRAGSPHVKTTWTIDGANIAIEYGRPSIKGRTDAMLMPLGAPWRTGADEATFLTSDKPLKFGTLTVPAGTHTINTQPGENEWQLIIGEVGTPNQWGIPYRPNLEKGRAPMRIGAARAPVEMLTISIDDTPAGATLRIEWGTKSATIPFTVG